MGCFASGSFTIGFFRFLELPAAGFAVALFSKADFAVALLGAADFLGVADFAVALLPDLAVALLPILDETVLAGDFAAGFLSGFFAVVLFAVVLFADVLGAVFEDFLSVFFAADLLSTLLADTVFALTFFVLLAGALAGFATGFSCPPTSERMNFLTLNPDLSGADFAAGFFDRSVVFVVLFELTAILLSCPPWVGLVTANR